MSGNQDGDGQRASDSHNRPIAAGQGSSHSHSYLYDADGALVELHGTPFTAPTALRRAVVAALMLIAALTVAGMVALWPNAAAVEDLIQRASGLTGESQTVRGEVLSTSAACAATGGQAGGVQAASGEVEGRVPCVAVRIGLLDGLDTGQLVTIEVTGAQATSGLRAGDTVQLTASAPIDAQAPESASAQQRGALQLSYALAGPERTVPLVILALLFAAVVITVGRLRGFLALAALGVSGAVLLVFVLPALLAGGPGLAIGMVGSTAIMFVTLFFVHGWNLRTASALIGTLFGILMVSGISLVAVASTRLTGLGDEAAGLLSGFAPTLDLRGILTCSILIAGLGVLNDITIAQASSVWELRAAAPQLSRRDIYARAMRIGRDHIASTVYTVVFAYAGAALSVLLLVYAAGAPVFELLSREDFAIEIVRTLCGSVGLVLAVPVTTAVAAWLVPAQLGSHTSATR